jgi:hypothetical protein
LIVLSRPSSYGPLVPGITEWRKTIAHNQLVPGEPDKEGRGEFLYIRRGKAASSRVLISLTDCISHRLPQSAANVAKNGLRNISCAETNRRYVIAAVAAIIALVIQYYIVFVSGYPRYAAIFRPNRSIHREARAIL